MKLFAALSVGTLFLSGGCAAAVPCTPTYPQPGTVIFQVEARATQTLDAVWRCTVGHLSAVKSVKVEIRLGPGLYRLEQPIEIPADWSARSISLTISGTDAVLSGAKLVEALNPYRSGEGGLVAAPLPPALKALALESSIREHGSLPAVAPINLLVDGQIRWRTEWPRDDYYRVETLSESAHIISLKTPKDLQLVEGMQIQGFFRHEWADATRTVDVANSSKSEHTLTLAVKGTWPKYGAQAGGRFKVMNSPQHVLGTQASAFVPSLNAFIFQGPASPSTVEHTFLSELIKGSDVSNVTLSGLTFTGARHTAVMLKGKGIAVRGCVFHDNGLSALRITGQDVLVAHSRFVRHGGTPVFLSGGNRSTLVGANIRFERNEVADFGRLVWSSVPGLRVDGVGIRVEKNLIHDGPHAGIFFFGNDHLIQGNEVHSVAKRTGDVGAIYTGRDWAGRGHRVIANLVHSLGGEGELKSTAIYLDDQASGVEVAGNLVVNAPRGVLLGGGRDNRIEHNYFSAVPICIRADARGERWQRQASGPSGELWKRLESVPYRSLRWVERYPGVDDVARFKTGSPVRNVVLNNVGETCEWDIDEPVRSLGSVSLNKDQSNLKYRLNPEAVGPASADRADQPLFTIDATAQ